MMAEYITIGTKKENWRDWILALLIGIGVVVGNFIMNHLP
jgi:hypothetical protein